MVIAGGKDVGSFDTLNDGWIPHTRTCEQQADGSEGTLNGPQLHDSLVELCGAALYDQTSWEKSYKLVHREIGVHSY